ncbi:hypothetical protein F8M41_005734 [Gigaspora margarita]|uniref:Uncharacterized protein n=1 Tax=Gigaspora margarita TaxID=4874 RepID=A0A8H4A5W0_GIGMA|nr:hypothetical protein F8M41_005734 [Gigaspora margarita]
MSRKQSAKDILKTISQDSFNQSKSSTSTSNRLPTSTHRTQLNELRQPTLTSELNVLSQQTVTTVDLWSDIEREDNEPSLSGLNDEPLSSLDMDNFIIFTKKTPANIKC